jgi:stage V sporulation protein D (sporulation-specific penicillin-binding protein)
MDVNNGEILAMTDVPEFDLNDPFTLTQEYMVEGDSNETATNTQDLLNQMWRNGCINDTYEPGSTFKIITAAAGLESGVVTLNDHFNCPGYIVVDDRRIRCHKTTGHGSESFVDAVKVSCKQVCLGMKLMCNTIKKYLTFIFDDDYFYKYMLTRL